LLWDWGLWRLRRLNTATSEEEFVTGARAFQDAIGAAVERAKAKAGVGLNDIDAEMARRGLK